MRRINLTSEYSISKVIKGGWQLAGGHGLVDSDQAIVDMFAYYAAGITTFDCADIYTGVEELIGTFLAQLRSKLGADAANKVQVHTKYVPDLHTLGKITAADVERSIVRSINRLGVERLDLVQFHWWDFSVQQYVEVALILRDLQRQGLIRHIGLTNFDTVHAQELVDAGINPLANQVQYSALDRRPEQTLQSFCAENGMTMLCYGSLAGGFISEKYLGKTEPSSEALQTNRSLIKYKLIIDDMGGWAVFQVLLQKLSAIGAKHGLSVSEIALLYVLSKPSVGAVVVGARNSQHLDSLSAISQQNLTNEELAEIDQIFGGTTLAGDIYGLERNSEKHAKIMKYNLHKEK